MSEYSTNSARQSVLFVPPEPKTIDESGLDIGFLSDLILKVLYFQGYRKGSDIADVIRLPFQGVIDTVITFLVRERMVEIKGGTGVSRASYDFAITDRGSMRAREVLGRNQYIGPAPVNLQSYNKAIQQQTTQQIHVNPQTIREALSHLVISNKIIDQVGPAINSGRSLFLFGPPGNGKTSIAESIGRIILHNDIRIPYAVSVEGQIVKVFDELNHVRVEETEAQRERIDQRWVKIHRPVIVVGGELMLESLDLIFDDTAMFYEAPFQMKANGGMFLIDDFGRQQVRPRDLLNRWIVPLECRHDFLTLSTGKKIQVPFEQLIIFSTNLEPADLVDEAFLRRIPYKIEIGDPTPEEFHELFKLYARRYKCEYRPEVVEYLIDTHYRPTNRPMRRCQPRDLLGQIRNYCTYNSLPMEMKPEYFDRVVRSYFTVVVCKN